MIGTVDDAALRLVLKRVLARRKPGEGMGELLRDVLRGITAEPARFVAEVVQSTLVLVVLGWAGRRFVRRRLAARRETIAAQLADADAAERESVQLREEAAAAAARAREDSPAIVRTATEQADQERQASIARIESEALEVVAAGPPERRARQGAGSRHEASARLISLTAEAARRYLDEMLTESERRALTQKAILEALEEIAPGPPLREAGVA